VPALIQTKKEREKRKREERKKKRSEQHESAQNSGYTQETLFSIAKELGGQQKGCSEIRKRGSYKAGGVKMRPDGEKLPRQVGKRKTVLRKKGMFSRRRKEEVHNALSRRRTTNTSLSIPVVFRWP